MNLKTDHSFSSVNQLRYTSATVPAFIETTPNSAHLKDAQTRKYILSNSRCAELPGLKSPDNFIGLTSEDFTIENGIWQRWDLGAASKHWISQQRQVIEKLEYQTQTTHSPVISGLNIHFTPEGFILIEKLVKRPIFSRDNKKINAILSARQDLTLQRNLFYLLELYRRYYPDKQAIQHLLMFQGSKFPTETTDPDIRRLQDKVRVGDWAKTLAKLSTIPVHAHKYNA